MAAVNKTRRRVEFLYASSDSLEGLRPLVDRFYGGAEVTLGENGEIRNAKGEILSTVGWERRRGRYRFGHLATR